MIDIRLFGHVSVFEGDTHLTPREFHGVKPRHVLLLLAIDSGLPLSKERLADALWQGNPPASWLSTLEGYVSLLRRGLARLHPDEPSVVLTCAGGYLLDSSRVRTDLDRFDTMLIEAESDAAKGADTLPALTKALEVARGEVLAGERPLNWVLETRERYHHRVCRAAVKAGRLALRAGDIASAARHGQLARELDPLAEDGWQILIESQWLDGRRADALRSFKTLSNLLDRELGIEPCRALQQLLAQVLRDERFALSA